MTSLFHRLPDCGPALRSHFARLGKETTARDAFNAWLAWIEQSGGTTSVQYAPSPLYEHWAFQIREAARERKWK